jgi:hypothetical protein
VSRVAASRRGWRWSCWLQQAVVLRRWVQRAVARGQQARRSEACVHGWSGDCYVAALPSTQTPPAAQ